MTQSDKGTRVANFIADTLIVSIIIITLALVMYLYSPEIADNNSPAFNILFFIVFFSYYFFFEFFLGKTIGKMLTKTTVVDRNGNKPTALRLIIRTLVRMVPFEWFSFLFGNYGLHDLISKTTVVKIEALNTVRN